MFLIDLTFYCGLEVGCFAVLWFWVCACFTVEFGGFTLCLGGRFGIFLVSRFWVGMIRFPGRFVGFG